MTRAAPRRSFDWQRWVTIGLVALIALAAIGWWQIRANRHGLKLAAEFTSGLGVYKGSDVRILGVHVGTVDSVTPEGTTVLVKFHLDPGVKVAADTEAIVVSPNLVADRYLQLTGAYGGSGPTLADGTTLHTDRTATPVELDELYRSLTDLATALGPNGANSQGALARLLNTSAANLGGNGEQINSTLTNLSKAAGTLSTSKDALFATLSNLDQFTNMLAQNNSSLIQVNQQLASVSTVLANDRASFAAAMQQLGSALALVQQFIQNNRAALKTDVGKAVDAGEHAGRPARLAAADTQRGPVAGPELHQRLRPRSQRAAEPHRSQRAGRLGHHPGHDLERVDERARVVAGCRPADGGRPMRRLRLLEAP